MEALSILKGIGHDGKPKYPPVPSAFNPEDVGPALSGFQRPVRIEGEIFNLEVEGEIPKGISGTFYRIMPDPAFPPFIKDDIWINGDGVVSSFRIKDGHIDFKQRYVETEKLKLEREHRRTFLGKYRNPFTDATDHRVRTVANTTIFPWRDKLLALKEDGPPYAMDPKTLGTFGVYDFEGQWDSETFTAHPKYDAVTRELLCFGYEARGVGTKDVLYGCFNQHGIMTEKVWFEAPVCGFQHEMAATENWVLFPIHPMHLDSIDNLKAGGNHWQWYPERPYYIGVLPRRGGKASDVKWFYGDNAYNGHVANAWEEDGKIHLYMSHSKGNVFGFFPDKDGNSPPLGTNAAMLAHWTIDPKSENLEVEPEIVIEKDNEMIRVDDRYMCYKNKYIFGAMQDPTEGKTDWSLVSMRVGGGFPPFNSVYKVNLETGKVQTYWNGNYRLYQEPVFIPRHLDAPEGDGYLIGLTMNYDEMISELVILDTKDLSDHVAICRLPIRLRMGIHGNWVDDTDIDGHAQATAAGPQWKTNGAR